MPLTMPLFYFTMLRESNMGFVKLGNKDSSLGDICVSTNLGVKLTLKNVRLVPDLRLNLLSVHKFCS